MKIEQLMEALPASYTPPERTLVQDAYALATQVHRGQRRASGEPFIQHCLAVAQILAELRMPAPVVAAALLHDAVEDTDITLEQLSSEFGDEVARLVDGVTKLTQLPRVSHADGRQSDDDLQPALSHDDRRAAVQAETLRKTVLAMGEDVRVVLIKLADRLHNMRTLGYLPEEKRRRIAQETLDIFAPLANRLGIWRIKWELEDLAFRHVNPAKYKEIAAQLAERRPEREVKLERIVATLKAKLAEANIEAEASGRPKHIYSIWKKMERKGVSLEHVYDIRAVRVIVKDLPTCYVTLGIVHSLWKPLPHEFDDYIATPKDNFYQSLHTAVLYDDGKWLEVQIRTPEMHENAEFGIAAHWMYKEGMPADKAYEERVNWLRRLTEWRQEVTDGREFVDALRTDVFEDRVYAFTPKGDIIDLPQHATPVDFAYHVHTSVGERCRGARVNGVLVPLNHTLRTGDQVEIITAKRGGPSRDWLNPDLGYVYSARARQKIRQYFKKLARDENIAQGRELLERELKRLGMEAISHEEVARLLGFAKVEAFLEAVGCGDVTPRQIVLKISELQREEAQEGEPQDGREPRPLAPPVQADEINVLGTSGLLTMLARCCNPAPGDPIVGYITRGRGITVHRRDCPNALNLAESERLIRVGWGKVEKTYPVPVRILAYDRDGLMRDVSTLVAEERINMAAVDVNTDKKNNIATLMVTMEVTDLAKLARVLSRIEQLPNVLEARRWRAG